jgi:CBS domain-containing protein
MASEKEVEMTTAPTARQARYVGPPFEDAHVYDAMRVGVITCRPDTPLQSVAQMMATYNVHSVVVQDVGAGERPWGIVSTLDIAAVAASDLTEVTARDVASTDLVTIPSDESLPAAAKLMSEHGVTHLIAVDRATDLPCGVISAGGLAAALAAPR